MFDCHDWGHAPVMTTKNVSREIADSMTGEGIYKNESSAPHSVRKKGSYQSAQTNSMTGVSKGPGAN